MPPGWGLASAASILLPPNVYRALAKEPPKRGSLRDIKHVVVLTQENRSFDHYFGTLARVRGFNDSKALTLLDGKPVFHSSYPNKKGDCHGAL